VRTLNHTLRESSPALLRTLARVWDVDTDNLFEHSDVIDALTSVMLNPDNALRMWDTLDDKQRSALQLLNSAKPSKGKMAQRQFEMLAGGSIRKMGEAQIERERPDKKPSNTAEALYYRGLIAQGHEQTPTGPRPVIYIPDDLMSILPMHKTQYDTLDEVEDDFPDEDEDEEELPVPKAAGAAKAPDAPKAPTASKAARAPKPPPQPEEEEEDESGVRPLDDVSNARNADTSIVDDLTTVLAYLQLQSPRLDIDERIAQFPLYRLAQNDVDLLQSHLLTRGTERLTFLVGLALSANLLEEKNGQAITQRAEARRWLEAPRAEQVRVLVNAWLNTPLYRDLWHVPGLDPEPGGTLSSYDAAAVRKAVMGFIADLIPPQNWWSIDSFVETVKEADPDFQRPDGNYDTWYIRNQAGDYLEGFESWDAVEGALLEFYLFGPMHWLGLVDVADDAARLTAYGRAALNIGPWPNPPEPHDKVTVRDDGTLLVSRKVSRIDRFQVARFTSWVSAGDPYTYKLDARGVSRGATQGINTTHIAAFVSKQLNDAPLPPTLARLLDSWTAGPKTSVSLEKLLVLRTTSPEVMERIWAAPALRRYLGARLGEMAVIVRADSWEALRDALGEQGIEVETSGT
jgi:hypothetical protein